MFSELQAASISSPEIVTLLWLVAVTMLGTLFNPWRNAKRSGAMSAAILVGISGILLYSEIQEDSAIFSSLLFYVPLVAGLAFGLVFPCCAPSGRVAYLQFFGMLVLILHCLLDGHVVREMRSFPLLMLMSLHKFLDGVDARILSLENRVLALVTRATLILATPIGFLFLPETVIGRPFHLLTFSAIVGLNFGSAVHIIRHEKVFLFLTKPNSIRN